MTRILLTISMLTAFAAPGFGQARYDRTLEQAVMEIVARKIDGTLRGSLPWNQKLAFVRQERAAPAGADWSLR